MALIVLLAWIIALAVAVGVLGFCAYELTWKTRRLQRDLSALHELDERLAGIRERLAVTRERASAVTAGQ